MAMAKDIMDIKTFRKYAEKAYGTEWWQTPLAEELRVSRQTVSNWNTGRTPLPLLVQHFVLNKLAKTKKS